MKTKQTLLALITLIMATAFFSCSMDMPEAESLSDSDISRSSASECTTTDSCKEFCFTVGYSKESTGDGAIKSSSTKSGTYVQGTEIVVEAAPCLTSADFFTGWYDAPRGGKLVSEEATYRFKLTDKTALYARFDNTKVRNHRLIVGYSGFSDADGSIKSSKVDGYYAEGTEIVVEADPCKDFESKFSGWFYGPFNHELVSKEAKYRFKINGYTSLYARFDLTSSKQYNFSIGYSSKSTADGSIIKSSGSGSYKEGTWIVAVAETNDRFGGWYDPEGKLVSKQAIYKFNLTADITIRARFDKGEDPDVVNNPDVIKFEDPAFERLIRAMLRRPYGPITKTLAAKVTYLSAPNNYKTTIKSLSGIEHFYNLEYLFLSDCNLTDISGLSSLKKLKNLYIRNNNIKDLSPLANLPQIRHLTISENPLVDIGTLPALPNLEIFVMQKAEANDISALAKQPKLRIVWLDFNRIEDISPLSNLKELEFIELSNNNIRHIPNMDSLINLKELKLGFNKIENIEGLTGLINLKELYIRNNRLTALPDLSRLKKLEILFLSMNKLYDITPIGEIKSLRKLYLSNNKLKNIEPLEYLPQLQTLYIEDCGLTDITPLLRNPHINRYFYWPSFQGNNIPQEQIDALIKKTRY